jgi:hypothetical protein
MIDLTDEGRIESGKIDLKFVCERFSDYVTPFFPDRGKDGFKPLWHLTNDRLWTFFNDGSPLRSSDFPHGAPASKSKLLAKASHAEISPEYIDLWQSDAERSTLRHYMLAILNESDSGSRSLVPPLFNKENLLKRDQWPGEEQLRAFFSHLTGQRDLFDAAANGIRRSGGDHSSPSFADISAIEAIENVPTAISYELRENKIAVVRDTASRPILPYATSERTHALRLEACKVMCQDLILRLKSQTWQVRTDYKSELENYIRWLPGEDDAGNLLLADGAARTIRHIFFDEREYLPTPFSAALKTFLEQHIALRAFYPEVEEFYRSVRSGRIDAPLPLDAVKDVMGVIDAQTPAIFDESVSKTVREATSFDPQIPQRDAAASEDLISPPVDPLGELAPAKANDFQTAGWVNSLWKIFKAGAIVNTSVEAWSKAVHALVGPVTIILNWLRDFLFK